MTNTADRTVICGTDGERKPAFICHHLTLESKSLGFYEPDAQAEEKNGWCGECDIYLAEHGGRWNDTTEAFANIYMICDVCFDRIKQSNVDQ